MITKNEQKLLKTSRKLDFSFGRTYNKVMIYKRQISEEIIKFLFEDEIIVLHGARQVGKTHILYWLQDFLKQQKQEVFYIDLEDSRNQRTLDLGVSEFIDLLKEEGVNLSKNKKSYIFIDEIQYLKNPSEFLKLIADHHKYLKLIVSGSSSFEIKSKFKDSLVGRTINFEIFNLSFYEFWLFRTGKEFPLSSLTIKKTEEIRLMYKEYVLFGGYPKIALTDSVEMKEKRLQQIIDTYIRKDIRELANIVDLDSFNKLLEILASQSGQMINITELSNTCNIAKQTIKKYLFILEQTYIIKLVRPYYSNLRREIKKTHKVFFYDTGLMQMLWLKTLQKEIIGNVFETSIFIELTKKYGTQSLYYWRTKDKKEIDFVLNNKNKLIPIEVKLNFYRCNQSNIDYFSKHHSVNSFKFVGLNGEKQKQNSFYPWEI